MTNENAINVLRYLSPPRTSKAAFDTFRQAIEMAIEALKEPQIIRCKDCKQFDPIYTFDRGVCGHWHSRTNACDFCSRADKKEATE